jgi:mevalonate kinase
MPAFSITAPGKVILFGEHAVVYGQPAIAFPVPNISTKVIIHANPQANPGTIHIIASDTGLNSNLDELGDQHPIRVAIDTLLAQVKLSTIPACDIHISSTIPIASGLGSGAAISIALIRALCSHLGIFLKDGEISDLAFKVEKIFHGTPSGIDNTVIAYNKPIFFIRGEKPRFITAKAPFHFVLADTGIRSKTVDMVAGVRRRLNQNGEKYEGIFQEIGKISHSALNKLETGDIPSIGSLMSQNHCLLQALEVSNDQLDNLVDSAMKHGSLGAKLVGAGGGGHIAALCNQNELHSLSEALLKTGAKNTIQITIQSGVTR